MKDTDRRTEREIVADPSVLSDTRRRRGPFTESAPLGSVCDVSVATTLAPLVQTIFGSRSPPVRVRCWDGSELGPAPGDPVPNATLVLRSPNALRRLLYAPGELGFGRAYVAGDIDLEGDVYAFLDLRRFLGEVRENVEVKLDAQGVRELVRVARQLGLIGAPLPPPLEEAHLRGRKHSKERDSAAVAHHYNVGNDFYRTVLGPTMAYSCAYWDRDGIGLDQAQEAKFELISRKLDLEPGMRLLDIGCGWGGMAMHAARHHGVRVVGITLATEQAELARKRVAEAGLGDQIEIRVQDYREVGDGPYDAVSSIGMSEHVGSERLSTYFGQVFSLLRAKGRFLNHAISSPDTAGGRVPSRSFVGRYVFPDGELIEVGSAITAMQNLGFEVRDVESLREHYALTLRAWVENLEANWDALVEHVGAGRARVWRLYMAAAAVNFESNRTAIHQVLAVRPATFGESGMPRTRSGFLDAG